MLENILDKKHVIKINLDENDFLPFSIVFDLLSYLDDFSLDKKIKNILSETFPKMVDYQNEIDLWVDLESIGEVTAIVAKELASCFVGMDRKICLEIDILSKLTRDNHLFLHYLQSDLNFKIIYRDKDNDDMLNRNKKNSTDYYSWLSNDKKIIFDFDKEIENILRFAWRCAELGSEEVAFKIIEKGHESATHPYLKQLYLVQLQFLRIASQYYLAAANEMRVVPNTFPELKHSYHLTKAWGSVLSRQIDQAEHHFHVAKVTVDQLPDDLNGIYRMNIFALFQHLKGYTSNAFLIEKRIKKMIGLFPHPRHQIAYINSINLARLYRYIDLYPESKKHYDDAFLTVRGIKTESDFIYSNVCYGMLYEKMGDFSLALRYWIKAAIHWVVTEVPEGLSWRAVRAIALPNFNPRSYLDENKISESLIRRIKYLADKANQPIHWVEGNESHFVLYNPDLLLEEACCFGISGLSIIAAKSDGNVEKPMNEIKKQLSHLTASLLSSLCHFSAQNYNLFVVDRIDGDDVPGTLSEIIRSCLLFNVNKIKYKKKYIEMTEELKSYFTDNLLIKMSDSILEVKANKNNPFVKHKRYFPVNYLSHLEYKIIKKLSTGPKKFHDLQADFGLTFESILKLMNRKLITVQGGSCSVNKRV